MLLGERRGKVALVIGQLTFGGAERQVVELSLGLLEDKRYEPVVVCYTNQHDPFGAILVNAGIPFVFPKQPIQHLLRPIWIRKQLLAKGCGIAYAFLNPPNVYTSLACIGTNLKFIASVRGVPELSGLLKYSLRFAMRKADVIIANSRSCQHWVINKYNAEPKKVVVVPNSVQTYSTNNVSRIKIREGLGVAEKDVVVGTIGLLKPEKQPLLFLNIAKNLIGNHDSPFHFVWVGGGPLYNRMEDELTNISGSLRSKIHLIGSKANVEDWFSVFDAFILTSESEGLSNALMEAMSIGLPCFATDVPGNRDIIRDGENGFLVSPNVESFTKKLIVLFTDNNICQILGQNAQQEMRSGYSRKMLTARTSQIFDLVLGIRRKY